MSKPPCIPTLGVTDCLRRQHDWLISGNGPLHGPWDGWRVTGDELVSPCGRRVRLLRVLAIMTMDSMNRKLPANVLEFRPRAAR